MLIALSGIDGSGKSSHGQAIRDAFDAIGVPSIGVTARIGRLTPLRLLLEMLRTRIHRGSRAGHAGRPMAESSRATSDAHWKGWKLTLWAIATVIDYAVWLQWVRWKLRGGTVVVADRYILDFAVEFSILVKSQPRLAALLLRPLPWIAPRPDRQYFMRIDPELSRLRKPDDQHGYDHDEVCAAYDALYARYGVRLVDNSGAFDDVSSVIVRDVLGV